MRPLRLTMQAFGSYGRREVVDFEKTNQNLFLITGDTGAGKSTIFDAVVFALYGEASSGINKKDGIELQSQYAGADTQPFVELVFSEGDETYTVRRIPRHARPKKRGSGIKEESGSVSLTLPDGTEYPQKETDRKLEEIIGLTKNQFMQVAMIAQGEFMELLRAKSDDKKVIFRKLFHTELYQKIVDELAGRRREKQQEIARIRTVCQMEVSHIVLPDTDENARKGAELKKRILSSDRLSVVDMEHLLDTLKLLCEKLEQRCGQADAEYDSANEAYLTGRDDYTQALQLLERFGELERAQKELEECAAEEAEIREMEALAVQIDAAYELRSVWERYADAARSVSEAERGLREQQDGLPERARACEEAGRLAKEAEDRLNQELQSFTKISERVEKALAVLKRMKKTQEDAKRAKEVCEEARLASENARRELERLEQQELAWRNEAEASGAAAVELAHWKTRRERADEAAGDLERIKALQKDVSDRREETEAARLRFGEASGAYEQKQRQYENARRIFLDAQAGFLAKERLRPGSPCPVCGSREHPDPCELKEEYRAIDREALETLGEEAARLRDDQEKAAADARSLSSLLAERERSLAEELQKLCRKLEEYAPQEDGGGEGRFDSGNRSAAEEERITEAQERLDGWNRSLAEEGRLIREKVRRLEEVQKLLRDAEGKKAELKAVSEQAGQREVEAKTALAGCEASLESLKGSVDFKTEEEARTALGAAKEKKENAKRERTAARVWEQQKRSEKEKAETLIRQYQESLPELESEASRRKAALEKRMEEKGLPETVWRSLSEQYDRDAAEEMRRRVSAHREKRAAAQRMEAAAAEAVGGRKRPVLEELKAALDASRQRMEAAKETRDEAREQYRINLQVYEALEPKMEERGRIMAEHKRLDDLYGLLSGNVTGGRMDLETYVQRYYLGQILCAANRRFYEMSAGQFELRMCSLEQAGTGKNRGLDLMVYSSVTGKEREVRTLSGGESFMAALSLALGMADLIQANAASVNLDVMFIDEGFGSLDDHSRAKAVRVLQEMAEGSKLIGIISHVTELKQEIEDQLIVTKDKNGSHISWQIS